MGVIDRLTGSGVADEPEAKDDETVTHEADQKREPQNELEHRSLAFFLARSFFFFSLSTSQSLPSVGSGMMCSTSLGSSSALMDLLRKNKGDK
jgi:hypothetical protein